MSRSNTDFPETQRPERVDPLPEETQAAARRTIAHFAKDAADCRLLLDILGLIPDVAEEDATAETPAPPPVSAPGLCGCGKPVIGASPYCAAHTAFAPAADARSALARIRAKTGWTAAEIAVKTGLSKPTIVAAARPRVDSIRRGTLVALERVAAEVGA